MCEHVRKLERQRDELLDAEHALSDAYLRLRRKLNAFDTPTAPTAEQVWSHTEAKLDEVIKQRDELLAALEKQACSTAYYNGHSDGYKPHPNGGLFWENYLCVEARAAIAKVKGQQWQPPNT